MSNEIPNREFSGLWIPREIWFVEGLSILDKCLFAEIHALDGKNGCTATNGYLSDFFGKSNSIIRESIARLQSKGLIIVEWPDSNHRVMHSMFKKAMEGVIKEQKNRETPPAEKSAPPCREIGTHKEYNIESPNGDIYPIVPKRDEFKKRKKIKEKKKEVAPRVWVTPTQEADLQKTFDETTLKEKYQAYSTWKIENGIEGGKDFTLIKKWRLEKNFKNKKSLDRIQPNPEFKKEIRAPDEYFKKLEEMKKNMS